MVHNPAHAAGRSNVDAGGQPQTGGAVNRPLEGTPLQRHHRGPAPYPTCTAVPSARAGRLAATAGKASRCSSSRVCKGEEHSQGSRGQMCVWRTRSREASRCSSPRACRQRGVGRRKMQQTEWEYGMMAAAGTITPDTGNSGLIN